MRPIEGCHKKGDVLMLRAFCILAAAEDLEKDITGLFKLDPALVTKLKDVLYN
jgi:hypothetical protein